LNCVRCSADVPADARFCPACGAPQRRSEAERRSLSVVFCDLVGSVALSTQLDPEDLRDLIRAYQQVCERAVARFEGHVAQYLGDGVLAYFGYPVAHEDDARRAVHASLEIVTGLQGVAAQWKRERGIELRLRIGVHSGPAVVGEMGGSGAGAQQAPLATGETPNIAARVQSLAEPGTVLISAATHALVRGYFRCERIADAQVKGVDQPLALHRVLGVTGAASRLAAAGEEGLLPFVGRGSVVDGLLARWGAVEAGRGQVVLLRGDAGIGKSRLLRTLRERIGGDLVRHLEAQCSPYHQSSAFAPIIEMIQRALDIGPHLAADERLAALRAGLSQVVTGEPEETLALIAGLMSIELPAAAPADTTPQRQRRRTIETLAELVVVSSRRVPTLLAFEDLHWADPSTLEFLDELLAHVPATPLLLVLTSRPEFAAPWVQPQRGISELMLDALPDEVAGAIVANAARGHALPARLLQRVLARAEGNPLYLEEITRVVVDAALPAGADEASMADTLIPATVQESLAARIDRLGPAKPIAQLAAALGRRFSYELLQAMAALPPPGLHDALARLVSEDLLVQHGTPPQAQFTFKHALLQDAAYGSLLRSRRQEIHGNVAQTLLERFPETCEAQPELPAQHYSEAGRTQEAIALWRKAAERAVARSSQAEAAAHLSRALELVRTLPLGAERVQAELTLLITLGPILMAIRGYADPKVEQTYRQARELCAAIGDTPQIVPVLFGLWAFYVVRGDLRIALGLVEQLLRLVRGSGDSGVELEAHLVHGTTLHFLAELEGARRAFESAIALYRPAEHRIHAQVFGQEPGAASHIYLAQTLAVMGEREAAAGHVLAADSIVQETSHSHTTAYCGWYQALLLRWEGDASGVHAAALRGIALSQEQGFPIWQAGGDILAGWAGVELGHDAEAALAQLRAGIDWCRSSGTELYMPYCMSLLASALAKLGRLDEARAQIDAAVAREAGGEQRISLAELYRLQAEIMQRQGAPQAEVRETLQRAIELATTQRATLWEQRARASLTRLGS